MKENKKGGMLQPTPFNEAPGDADSPNISGGGIYGSWDEIMSAHLSTESADLGSTPNMDSIEQIMGQTAPGEPVVMKPAPKRNSQA